MNVLFFLRPKAEVVYVDEDASLRQILEKMEYHRYSSMPIVSKDGKYRGTLSEGDILWYIKDKGKFDLSEMERINVKAIKRHHDNKAVKVDAKVEELIAAVIHQNFVPVVDDREIMIGIVTRQDIITYLSKQK